MYSVVLMAALTTTADTPAFGKRCSGCSGCYSSCSGSYGCSGCSSSCHGKRGGGLFGKKRSCHGCSSSCHGGYSSCSGGYGCTGGYGCSGGYGGYGCSGGMVGCSSGYGGYGCTGGMMGCAGGYGCGGGVVVPSGPVAPATKPETIKKPSTDRGTVLPAPATIMVSLPADAKLLIDDSPTTSTSANRLFVSPTLEQGKEYFYTLKAEVVREGKSVTLSKKVAVHAGEEARVAFELPATNVAQK